MTLHSVAFNLSKNTLKDDSSYIIFIKKVSIDYANKINSLKIQPYLILKKLKHKEEDVGACFPVTIGHSVIRHINVIARTN